MAREVFQQAYIYASVGASGFTELYRIEPGRRFRLRRLTINFPSGTGYTLRIVIYDGNIPVIPESGFIVGDDEKIVIETDKEFTPGSTIRVFYHNTDGAYPHAATVNIEGVEE